MAFRSGGVEFQIKLGINQRDIQNLRSVATLMEGLKNTMQKMQAPTMQMAVLFGRMNDSWKSTAQQLKAVTDAQARMVREVEKTSRAVSEQIKNNQRLVESQNNLSQGGMRLGGIFRDVAQAIGAWKLYDVAKDSALLAARVDSLGIVVKRVGVNAGYSAGEIDLLESRMKELGITTQASRVALSQMASSQLDLAQANKLARVAQDAAVIAGLDSSETLSRLVHGIVTAQVEVLRYAGVLVSPISAYRRFANETGRTIESLSEFEKRQIMLSEVLRYGTVIAGSYEASLESVGKRMGSMKRLWEEARVAFGKGFLPALETAVDDTSSLLKKFNEADPQFHAFTSSAATSATVLLGLNAIIGRLTASIPALGAALGPVGFALSAFAGGMMWLKQQKAVDLERLQRRKIEAGETAILTRELYERYEALLKLKQAVDVNAASQRRWNAAYKEFMSMQYKLRVARGLDPKVADAFPAAHLIETSRQQIARLTAEAEAARQAVDAAENAVKQSRTLVGSTGGGGFGQNFTAGTVWTSEEDAKKARDDYEVAQAALTAAKERVDYAELRRLNTLVERQQAAFSAAEAFESKYLKARAERVKDTNAQIVDSFVEYREALMADAMSLEQIDQRAMILLRTKRADVEANYAARERAAKDEFERTEIRLQKTRALLELENMISQEAEDQRQKREAIKKALTDSYQLTSEQLAEEKRLTAEMRRRLDLQELGVADSVIDAWQALSDAVRNHQMALSRMNEVRAKLMEDYQEALKAAALGDEMNGQRAEKILQEIEAVDQAIRQSQDKQTQVVREAQKEIVDETKSATEKRIDDARKLTDEIAELEGRATKVTADEVRKRIDARKKEYQEVADFIRDARVKLLDERLPGTADIIGSFDSFREQIQKAQSEGQLAELQSLFPQVLKSSLAQNDAGGIAGRRARSNVAMEAIRQLSMIIEKRRQALAEQQQQEAKEKALLDATITAKRAELAIAENLLSVEERRTAELERRLILQRMMLAQQRGDMAGMGAAQRDLQLLDAKQQQRQAERAAMAQGGKAQQGQAAPLPQAQPQRLPIMAQQPGLALGDMLSQARKMRQALASPLSLDEQRARASAISARKRGGYDAEMLRRKVSHAVGREVQLGQGGIGAVGDLLIRPGAAGAQAAQAMQGLRGALSDEMRSIQQAFSMMRQEADMTVEEIRSNKGRWSDMEKAAESAMKKLNRR